MKRSAGTRARAGRLRARPVWTTANATPAFGRVVTAQPAAASARRSGAVSGSPTRATRQAGAGATIARADHAENRIAIVESVFDYGLRCRAPTRCALAARASAVAGPVQ